MSNFNEGVPLYTIESAVHDYSKRTQILKHFVLLSSMLVVHAIYPNVIPADAYARLFVRSKFSILCLKVSNVKLTAPETDCPIQCKEGGTAGVTLDR